MWTCPKCDRIFQKKGQMHSCRKFPLELHFKNKDIAKELYDNLLAIISKKIGNFKVISLPCCIHLFGTYDFLALLPKRDKLEVRFSLDQVVKDPRIYISVPMSSRIFKNCLYIFKKEEVDDELIEWLEFSYNLKNDRE